MTVAFVLGTESRDPVEMETESDPMEENDSTQDMNGRALVWELQVAETNRAELRGSYRVPSFPFISILGLPVC